MPHILLVEDDAMNRDMFSRMLHLGGYRVSTVTNGDECTRQVERLLPDLIIMDASLPIVDGYEATRQIKANPNTRHIPVLMLTAHAMAEHRQRCFAAGCDAYESKPISYQQLLHAVSTLLQGHNERGQQ